MSIRDSRLGRPGGLSGSALLSVARDLMLDRGLAATSMDEIAHRAHISKSTLYRAHPSKSALFAAVVGEWVTAGRDSMRPALDHLVASPDPRAGLLELADTMRRGILSQPVLRMRRLVTSEADAYPEVAAAYLRDSWDANIANLAEALKQMTKDGRISAPDPQAAAEHLTWLVIGAPLNALLLTDEDRVNLRPADAAIDLFLAGYGPARLGQDPRGS